MARSGRVRQAILKQAFDGKLVRQSPSDEPAEVPIEKTITTEESNVEATLKQARLF